MIQSTVTLSANVEQSASISNKARFVKFVSFPSGATVQARFVKNNEQGVLITVLPGMFYEIADDEFFDLVLKSTVAGSVVLQYSDVERLRFDLDGAASGAISINTDEWSDNLATSASGTLAAAGGGPISAGPGVRPKAIWLSLSFLAPGPIYVGSQTLPVGVEIQPGTWVRFTSPDALVGGTNRSLNAFNPNPVAITYYLRMEF